jgi:hypothetical protein
LDGLVSCAVGLFDVPPIPVSPVGVLLCAKAGAAASSAAVQTARNKRAFTIVMSFLS